MQSLLPCRLTAFLKYVNFTFEACLAKISTKPGLPFADAVAEATEMMPPEDEKYFNIIQLIVKVI